MSLRTRLIIAFVLLSVVPLSAVTFLSFGDRSFGDRDRPLEGRGEPRKGRPLGVEG